MNLLKGFKPNQHLSVSQQKHFYLDELKSGMPPKKITERITGDFENGGYFWLQQLNQSVATSEELGPGPSLQHLCFGRAGFDDDREK